MDDHEAERKQAQGEQLLEALGDIPAVYAFACELPAAHGEPLSDLDRLWHDHYRALDRDWLVVLNGRSEHAHLESLNATLEGGAALVVADGVVLARLAPVGVDWIRDPDTGDAVADAAYWDDHLLESFHSRLVENGKDLPDLSTLVSKQD